MRIVEGPVEDLRPFYEILDSETVFSVHSKKGPPTFASKVSRSGLILYTAVSDEPRYLAKPDLLLS
jgi:hypothetical protein